MMMVKDQASELYYEEDNPYGVSESYHKPKNNPVAHYVAPYPAPLVHPIVQLFFWVLVGGVGLTLAIGTTIAATKEPSGDEWTLIIPLVYMFWAMYFFRRN